MHGLDAIRAHLPATFTRHRQWSFIFVTDTPDNATTVPLYETKNSQNWRVSIFTPAYFEIGRSGIFSAKQKEVLDIVIVGRMSNVRVAVTHLMNFSGHGTCASLSWTTSLSTGMRRNCYLVRTKEKEKLETGGHLPPGIRESASIQTKWRLVLQVSVLRKWWLVHQMWCPVTRLGRGPKLHRRIACALHHITVKTQVAGSLCF